MQIRTYTPAIVKDMEDPSKNLFRLASRCYDEYFTLDAWLKFLLVIFGFENYF